MGAPKSPVSRRSRGFPRCILLLPLAGVTTALVTAAGCQRGGVTPVQPAVATGPPAFVGSAACKECHPREYRTWEGGRHATTLHPADRQGLAAVGIPAGPVAGTKYVLEPRQDGYALGVAGKPASFTQATMIYGSGKTGVTLVAVADGLKLKRLRMSYYPAIKRWIVQPGEESFPLYSPPTEKEEQEARDCVNCHTTGVPEDRLKPQGNEYGVGCEKCHGAGSNHIAAARTGLKSRADLHIEGLKNMDGRAVNEMCGVCHGKSPTGDTMLNPVQTQRLLSSALMQSRCFWQSGEQLSCLTCHDPHTDVSTDEAHYTRACLSCHAPDAHPTVPTAKGNPCPKNPRDKCTSCHMPGIRRFKNLPTVMTDHYIRPPRFMAQ